MENTNEIMVNEEVMESAEEIVTASSGKALKTLGIIGGVILVSGLAYKYAIKPAIAKVKAKKEQAEREAMEEVEIDEDIIDADVESEE